MNITRHIPNTITSMNLLCGVLGVICVFSGESDTAFLLMLLAAVCDFFDGFSARALKAYSAIGKELDSLADLVSFGLLPSLMLHRMMTVLSPEAGLLCYLPLLIVVASALRLAKFNTDDRQSENFLGLATPACAMICGSMTYYIMKDSDSFLTVWASGRIFIPLVSIMLSALMVCELPMFSMKVRKGSQKNTPLYRMRISFIGTMVVSAVLVLLLGLNWSMIVLLVFVLYIIINVIGVLTTKK
ncbi:MAG: CDP-alcohol phosphatidyltransferase family protein [Bacteroidetes bacterium]|uniref:CDP-alcohol phosphatidyltransferase family protein n=1 Tax=Candidatus Cryptobacteroides gallistercoris TaxID=2840765 RepID=A0A940DLQ6_9BACT|nr:CDP-alcohol phosphatidyltransferase family protein [Candidatus Cryptobacteroides gallistercoris]